MRKYVYEVVERSVVRVGVSADLPQALPDSLHDLDALSSTTSFYMWTVYFAVVIALSLVFIHVIGRRISYDEGFDDGFATRSSMCRTSSTPGQNLDMGHGIVALVISGTRSRLVRVIDIEVDGRNITPSCTLFAEPGVMLGGVERPQRPQLAVRSFFGLFMVHSLS